MINYLAVSDYSFGIAAANAAGMWSFLVGTATDGGSPTAVLKDLGEAQELLENRDGSMPEGLLR